MEVVQRRKAPSDSTIEGCGGLGNRGTALLAKENRPGPSELNVEEEPKLCCGYELERNGEAKDNRIVPSGRMSKRMMAVFR